MKDGLRFGVIGLGFGMNHARVLTSLPGVRLDAVCDFDAGRLASFSGDARRYASYEEMLERERLDAVVIAVPASAHLQVGLGAIEHGCALLMEKPLAGMHAEGLRLVEAARRRGVALMPGHIERFNPALQALVARVNSGEIGNVVQVTARRMGAIRIPPRDVNVVHDSAIHDIDAMRWVLGQDPLEVYAAGSRVLGLGVEDNVTGVLKFEADGPPAGVLGSLEVSWLSPRRVRDLAVLGESGLFVLRYAGQTLEYFKAPLRSGPVQGWSLSTSPEDGAAVPVPVRPREQLVEELSAFVNALRGECAMPVTPEDGLAALAIADALTASTRTGEPISLRSLL